MLRPGTPAPAFRGPDQHGRDVSLEALLTEGPVVLFFYPKDFTTVCSREVRAFEGSSAELAGMGARLVGVSVDDPATHRRFAERHGLAFSLLSDRNREVARAYDALQPFGLVTKRITYVIGREGVIHGAFHHELSAARHVRDARAVLRTLAGPAS